MKAMEVIENWKNKFERLTSEYCFDDILTFSIFADVWRRRFKTLGYLDVDLGNTDNA